MSAKPKSPWKEEDIPDTYNEFDSEEDQTTPLRTVVEFELFDKVTGELVHFDDLGDSSRHISMRGFVVEPLPSAWREIVNSLLSTTPTEQLDLNIAAAPSKKRKPVDGEAVSTDEVNEEVSEDSNEPVAVLDWESLKVGDNVDGYCNKTFKWYEAKVVQIDREKNRYKVHFQGWNSKYDEWVEKFSQRLVAFRTSHIIMQEAVKNAARLVPWYQYNLLMKRAQEMLMQNFPSRQPRFVVIDKVDDWCVDYTYANPTLWLICGENWYRVAGALCPGGCFGSPSDDYRRHFFPALEKYLCAAHTSMILLDQLPTNPGVSFQAVIDEASKRSIGMVNEVNCLKHYQFLMDQLSSIELPVEWDPKVTITKSLFMSHLKREGDAFVSSGGMESLMANTYKGPHVKRRSAVAQQYSSLLIDLNQADINATHVAVMHLKTGDEAPKSARKSKKAKTVEKEERPEEIVETVAPIVPNPKKRKKIEFPMEDPQLWSHEFSVNKKESSPLPVPILSDQLLDMESNDPKLSFHFHNLLLNVMTTLTNFRNTLKLPIFHLRDLEAAIQCSESSVHPLLRQMCISMLLVIIRAYVQGGLIKTVHTEGRRLTSDLDEEENDCREPLILEAAKSEESLLKFLQVGENWIEVTKVICEKVDFAEFAIAIEGFTDPMRACQEIFVDMVQTFNTLPFSHPIDPDFHGLEDYFEIISEPMDFGTIKARLASGWYEPEDNYSFPSVQDESSSACDPDETHFDATIVKLKRPQDPYFQIGQFVDFYDKTLLKWIEAVIESRHYGNATNNLAITSEEPKVLGYWIRRVGFVSPPCVNLYVSVDDADSLIQHRAASAERFRRVMPPDEFFAKYPQHAPMPNESWSSQRLGSTAETTRNGGYGGFAKDMRLIWNNCAKYYGHFGENSENNEYVLEAQKMETYFEREFGKRILRFVKEDHSIVIPAIIEETYQQQYYRPIECWKLALKALASTESREVVHEAVPQISVSDDLEMLHLLALMKRRSFLDLRVCEKVVFLHWLCYSFQDTDFVHNELNSTASVPKQLIPLKQLTAQQEKENVVSVTADEDGAMDIDEILAGEEEEDPNSTNKPSATSSATKKKPVAGSISKSSSRGSMNGGTDSINAPKTPVANKANAKKRPRDGDNDGDGREEAVAVSATTSSVSGKKKSRNADKDLLAGTTTTTDTSEPVVAGPSTVEKAKKWGAKRGTDEVMLHRHDCLGTDRFGNRYWTFSDHCTQIPTLFCEARFQVAVATIEYQIAQPKSPCWLLYSHPEDIMRLILWLDERGNSEALLLRALYEWVRENGVTLPTSSSTVSTEPVKSSITEESSTTVADASLVLTTKSGTERKRKSEERLCYEMITKWRLNNYSIEKQEAYRTQELTDEEIHLRANHFLPLTNHTTSFYFLHVTFSSQAKQLGMGVKAATDGSVYVTSFASSESITKKAEFCIGDRLIFAGSRLRPNVVSLVDMVKKAGQDIENDKTGRVTRRLTFVVRRMCVPIEDPMFRAICGKDPEIMKQYSREIHEKDRHLQQVVDDFRPHQHENRAVQAIQHGPYVCNMKDQSYFFNDVMSMFMEVWLKLAHPAFTTQYFRTVLLEGWLTKILDVITDTSDTTLHTNGTYLCQYVARAMLDLEWDLYRVGSVLSDDWLGAHIGHEGCFTAAGTGNIASSSSAGGAANANPSSAASSGVIGGPVFVPSRIAIHGCHSRRRQQWRDYCRNRVENVETLSFAVATFMYHAVDWDLFQRQLIPVPPSRIPSVLQQVGMEEDFVGHLLKEGNRLVYFGDGHVEAALADRDLHASCHQQYFHVLADKYFRRPLIRGPGGVAGAQGIGKLIPYRRSTVLWGDSLPPQAGAVWLCQIAKVQVFHTTVPFVQLTMHMLTPAAQNNQSFPAPSAVLPLPSHKVSLSRHLLRILSFMKKANNCKPFLTPVSAEEYPSYCEIVTQPIDLGIIEKKILAQQYAHYTLFIEDVRLLYQNCCDFCGADSKKYPPMARGLLRDAQRLCRKYFDVDYAEGMDMDDNAREDAADGNERQNATGDSEEPDDDERATGNVTDAGDALATAKDTKMDVDEDLLATSSRPSSLVTSPMRRSNRLSSETIQVGEDQQSTAMNVADMVDEQAEKSTAAPTSQGGASSQPQQQQALKSMTISVRLDRLWPTFLVEQDIYTRCLKRWNAGMITANKSTVRVEIAPDRQGNPRYATGVVVGSKAPTTVSGRNTSAAKVMPWEFIQVDWTEPADAALLPAYVNCWDVDVIPDK